MKLPICLERLVNEGIKDRSYVERELFLHKLDPRTKLLGCFVMIITSLLKKQHKRLIYKCSSPFTMYIALWNKI